MRFLCGVGIVLIALSLAPAAARAREDILKDPEGNAFAVVLDCSTCRTRKQVASCSGGAEHGFHDGSPCGQCLMDANYGARIGYAYDLLFTGRLTDEKGQPVQGKFVRLLMPNTWAVRTRTSREGRFRLTFGATLKRKSKKPLVIDLGERTIAHDSKAAQYLLYMLPREYKPCKAKKHPLNSTDTETPATGSKLSGR